MGTGVTVSGIQGFGANGSAVGIAGIVCRGVTTHGKVNKETRGRRKK
jgi:hypothetical protein